MAEPRLMIRCSQWMMARAHRYKADTTCTWLIKPTRMHPAPITLTFGRFDLEDGFDFLEVYSAPTRPPDRAACLLTHTSCLLAHPPLVLPAYPKWPILNAPAHPLVPHFLRPSLPNCRSDCPQNSPLTVHRLRSDCLLTVHRTVR